MIGIIIVIILIFILLLYYYYKSIDQIDQFDSSYNNIDIIYYINLDHRTDRNNQFLDEIKKIDFPSNKVKRISAIYHDKGAIGCSKSHINTLMDFIQSPHNTCIIFEDDFEFTVSKKEFKTQLYNIFNNNIDFDVILLAGHVINMVPSGYNFINKINNAQTTSGYIVTKKFAKNYLLNNFIEGEKLLENSYLNNNYKEYDYAIDQYWKKLQPDGKWYICNPKVGKQRASYSDIIKGNVNYELFT